MHFARLIDKLGPHEQDERFSIIMRTRNSVLHEYTSSPFLVPCCLIVTPRFRGDRSNISYRICSSDIPQFATRRETQRSLVKDLRPPLKKKNLILLQNSSTISRATLFATTTKHRTPYHIPMDKHTAYAPRSNHHHPSTPSFRPFARLYTFTRIWSSIIYRPDTCRRARVRSNKRVSSSSLVLGHDVPIKKKEKKKIANIGKLSVEIVLSSEMAGPIIEGVIVRCRFPLEITPFPRGSRNSRQRPLFILDAG